MTIKKYRLILRWRIIVSGITLVVASSLTSCVEKNQQVATTKTESPDRISTSATTDNIWVISTPTVPISTQIDSTEDGTPTSITSELVTIQLVDDRLVVTNNTSSTIYYEAFPQEILALIEWAPCTDPANCQEQEIDAGQIEDIRLDTIAESNTEIVTVFWWHLVARTDGEGFYATDLTFIDVRIR